MIKGFKEFILRGNVVDLAVAVVIGAAFGAVVTALVADIFTPLIAAIIGRHDFSTLSFTINKSKFRLRRLHQQGHLVPADRGGRPRHLERRRRTGPGTRPRHGLIA